MPKISELATQASPTTAAVVPIVQAGTTEKATLATLPISTPTQAALDLKAATTYVDTGLALKAPIASPTFTGTTTIPTVAIAAGTITGITDLAIADGGTGASTAATARTNLGFTSTVIDRSYTEYTANADLTATIPLDDTIPQNTEGTQILSVSFTPKTTTNRLRLRFQGEFSVGTASNGIAALFSSTSANALRATTVTMDTAGYARLFYIEHEYVPGVTSAITFSVRVGPNIAATMRLNGTNTARLLGGAMAATLVIEEITA